MNGQVVLETETGAFRVNRYIVTMGKDRAVVLYWYQTPRRVIAGEWAAKFWVVIDGLRDKRTDTTMVRVITWATGGDDRGATAAAVSFAQDLYPWLRTHLGTGDSRPH